MRRPTLPLVLFAISLPLMVSRSREATAAGPDWRRVITAATPGSALVALGEPFDVRVLDELVGPTTCTEGDGCGGPRCSTPTERNGHTVESLSCTGPAACTATSRSSEKGVSVIAIDAAEEGRATVSLGLRDLRGDLRTITFTVDFARPTTIGVARTIADSPHGTTYAALAGSAYTWCARVERDGRPLLFNEEKLTVGAKGKGVTGMDTVAVSRGYPVCRRFAVTEPANVDIDYHFGSLARGETIRVVGTDEIIGLELMEVPALEEPYPIERDPFARAKALESLVIDGCPSGPRPLYVPRARTKFGAIALGAAIVRVEPEELAAASSARDGRGVPTVLFGLSSLHRGRGALRLLGGRADVTLPLDVVGRCHPDLEPKAADAGAEEDAGASTVGDAGSPSDDGGP